MPEKVVSSGIGLIDYIPLYEEIEKEGWEQHLITEV